MQPSLAPDGRSATPDHADPWVSGSAAGWDLCPPEVLWSTLELVAAGTQAQLCGLAWDASDGGLRFVRAAGEPPEQEQLSAWLALAAADAQPADDDVHVAPMRAQMGGALVGALVVRPGGGIAGKEVAALVDPAARSLAAWRDHSRSETERSLAYEALVEIGTQLQAEEVHADTVLQLIVDRARELCATDVAWLSLVDESERLVRVVGASGSHTEPFLSMAVRVGTGIGGTAVARGCTILVRDRDLYDNDLPLSVRRALEDEGVVSVLCSPMVRAGRMVGALYLGSRSPTDFGPGPSAVLPALATQAAIAVENGRLYQALEDRNTTLERAASIHRDLTDASLAGEGLDHILELLSTLVGSPVTLEREPAGPGMAPEAVEPDPPSGDDELRAAVMAGETRLGTLAVENGFAIGALGRQALEHGATVIALELVKERAALEVEWRLHGELLDELLSTDGEPDESLRVRAEHAGIALDDPRQIAVVRSRGDAGQDYLLRLSHFPMGQGGAPLATRRGDRVVLAISGADAQRAREIVASLQERARRAGVETRAGLGDRRTDLSLSLREAEAALAFAEHSRDAVALVTCEQLGPLRFLLDCRDTRQMEAFVRERLGPLADYDRTHRRGALLETVAAFLEHDGSQANAAAACHIHISTLKYRIARAAEVLGVAPHDPQTRYELRLAFSVLDVLRSLDVDPLDRPA
jgi:sugar diacid utilization regulator/putative methionine-R-sulfoxide reductase with GAF domain